MYQKVDDKDFLNQSFRLCSGIVNQLVQLLKRYDINAGMNVVGSKKRNMITQNGKNGIDYDFNLLIHNAADFSGRELKNLIQKAFNQVLNDNGMSDCEDSTSALTTKAIHFEKGNRTGFKMDVCIVSYNSDGRLQRLIHKKTGRVQDDRWFWNIVSNSEFLREKEEFLKPKHWLKVRETYLRKKNEYLSKQDTNHPSFICYIEAVNEVYDSVQNGNTGSIRFMK